MAWAAILIPEMRNLVTGLDQGVQDLRIAKGVLSGYTYSYSVDTLGSAVDQAIDWCEAQLPDVRRRLAKAEQLEQEPEPGWPTGHVEFDDSDISSVPPDEARQNGADAAQQLLDGNGELDEDLANELLANMNDPYFAEGFASAASPEEISDAIWEMNNQHQWLGSSENPDNALRETYLDMLEGLGTTLGTATRNTGDLALPSDYAQEWVDLLTSSPEDHKDEGDNERGGHPQALGVLLDYGSYSTDFLDHVSTELYNFERSADGDPVWGPRAEDPLHVVIWDGNGNPASDVMPYVMSALGNNPEASQNFFDGGPTIEVEINGEKVQVNERLQYMIQERTWSPSDGSDDGVGLGSALEAATTHYRDRTENGQDSAQIASQTFALIGDETMNNDGWKMWNGMRGNVANMLSSYGPDLLRIAGQGEPDSGFPGQWTLSPETDLYGDVAPYGASMDPALIQQILGTFGEEGNDERLETVLAGVAGASQWRLSTALDGALQDGTPPPAPVAILTGENVPLISTATNEMASALGWVINGAYHGRLDEDDLKRKRAEMASQVFGALTAIPGVAPTKDLAKFTFTQVTGLIKTEMGKVSTTSGGDFAELSSEQKEQLEHMIINQMLASGYWDDKYIDEANGGGSRYSGPPEEAIIPGEPPRVDFESGAYKAWLRRTYPLDEFLDTHIYPNFNEALKDGLALGGR